MRDTHDPPALHHRKTLSGRVRTGVECTKICLSELMSEAVR